MPPSEPSVALNAKSLCPRNFLLLIEETGLMSVTAEFFNFEYCLAQSRIDAMNEAFRQQSKVNFGVLIPFLGVVVGAVLLGVLIHYYYDRKQRRPLANNPKLLFQELCKAHSLNFAQRRALRKLARVRRLSNPCLVFVDIRLWPTNSEAQRLLGGWTRRKLCELRRNLFQPLQSP